MARNCKLKRFPSLGGPAPRCPGGFSGPVLCPALLSAVAALGSSQLGCCRAPCGSSVGTCVRRTQTFAVGGGQGTGCPEMPRSHPLQPVSGYPPRPRNFTDRSELGPCGGDITSHWTQGPAHPQGSSVCPWGWRSLDFPLERQEGFQCSETHFGLPTMHLHRFKLLRSLWVVGC